jgi:hypothetical protein
MSSTSLVYFIAGVFLMGFAGLGLIAGSELEQQYGAFAPSAWGAVAFSIASAIGGAAAFLRVS